MDEYNQLLKKIVEIEDELIKLKLELKIRDEMINAIPNPLFVKNKDFKYIKCNDAFADNLGLPKSKIINSTVYDISPKELADKYHAADCELRDQLGKQEYQSKVKYADGTLHDIIFNKACVVDEENEFSGIVGIMLDISERKRAEEKIAHFQKAFESSNEAIGISDANWGHSYQNKAFTDLFGYSLEELARLTPEVLYNSPEDAKALLSQVKTGKSWAREIEMKSKDGRVFPVYLRADAIFDDKNRIIGLIGIHQDITQKKIAEHELIAAKEKAEESKEKFKLLNRLTSEMLLLQDSESIYKFVAENLQKLYPNTVVLKVSIDESTGQTKLEAVSGLDNSLLMKVIKITGFNPIGKNYKLTDIHNSYFKSGKFIEFNGGLAEFSVSEFPAFAATAIEKLIGLHKIYTIGINKNDGLLGALHFVTFNNQVITDGDFIEIFAKQVGLVLQKKIDKNALIKAKEKAEESDRLKSAFLANMSHEIRTPMNGILGFTSLLLEPDLASETQQKYIEIIEKSGERMLKTVNDIIDISKIEAGLVELSLKEVNINEQLKYLHSFFQPEAAKNGTQLLLKNKYEQDFSIKTDLEKFNSIVTNLVKNAIKFTNQGTIEMGYSIEKENGFAEVEFFVKDTGSGIPKDRQKAIFERFVQADIEDKRAKQGSGLGLAISKAYAEMLGGKMWVESDEGKGSTFYFTIKCKTESESKAKAKNNEQTFKEENINRNLKILIVEDDEASQELISIVVEKFAEKIIIVSSGLEAVDACRHNPDIDLILMDIQLPIMNGYEATRKIRQFNKKVVILAQTAYALSGDKEKAISMGCNDYIAKPIDKTELHSIIQKHFEN